MLSRWQWTELTSEQAGSPRVNPRPLRLLDFVTPLNQQRKLICFTLWKCFISPPDFPFHAVWILLRSFSQKLSAGYYRALRDGIRSLCNVWRPLRHFFSTENPLESHREESKILLVLEDIAWAQEHLVQVFWCYNLKTNNTAIQLIANIWVAHIILIESGSFWGPPIIFKGWLKVLIRNIFCVRMSLC